MRPLAISCGILTRDAISQLRAEGVSVGDIADRAGVTRSTMHNAIAVWGIPKIRGGDRRSRFWRLLFREQLANAMRRGVA